MRKTSGRKDLSRTRRPSGARKTQSCLKTALIRSPNPETRLLQIAISSNGLTSLLLSVCAVYGIFSNEEGARAIRRKLRLYSQQHHGDAVCTVLVDPPQACNRSVKKFLHGSRDCCERSRLQTQQVSKAADGGIRRRPSTLLW